MLKEKIGVVIAMLGISTMDSACLIVPVALLAVGMFLMRGLLTDDCDRDN